MNSTTQHFKDIATSRTKVHLENATHFTRNLLHAHLIISEQAAMKVRLQGVSVQSGLLRLIKTVDGDYLIDSNKAILPPGTDLPNRLTIDDIVNLLPKSDGGAQGAFLKIIHQSSGAGLEIRNIVDLMGRNPEISLAAEAAMIIKKLEKEGTDFTDPNSTVRVKQVISEVTQGLGQNENLHYSGSKPTLRR